MPDRSHPGRARPAAPCRGRPAPPSSGNCCRLPSAIWPGPGPARAARAGRAATGSTYVDAGGGTGGFAVPLAEARPPGHGRSTRARTALAALSRRTAERRPAVREGPRPCRAIVDRPARRLRAARQRQTWSCATAILEVVDDPAEALAAVFDGACAPGGSAQPARRRPRTRSCSRAPSPARLASRPAHVLTDPLPVAGDRRIRRRPPVLPRRRVQDCWSPAGGCRPAASAQVHGVRAFVLRSSPVPPTPEPRGRRRPAPSRPRPMTRPTTRRCSPWSGPLAARPPVFRDLASPAAPARSANPPADRLRSRALHAAPVTRRPDDGT